MSTNNELLDAIFDGRQPPLYGEFELWLRDSRRFKAFAESYRSKIRAKLKNARHDGGWLDVRAELQVAALLSREDRFTLEYERYAAVKQRGPDFTVTFKTHTAFNVEVRRVRGGELMEIDSSARVSKLLLIIMDKARQMPPGIVNLLWVVGEEANLEEDLNVAATTLRQAIETRDQGFFTRRGYEGSSDFLKKYRHLSGIILQQSGQNRVWLNSFARHKVPPEIKTALERLVEASRS